MDSLKHVESQMMKYNQPFTALKLFGQEIQRGVSILLFNTPKPRNNFYISRTIDDTHTYFYQQLKYNLLCDFLEIFHTPGDIIWVDTDGGCGVKSTQSFDCINFTSHLINTIDVKDNLCIKHNMKVYSSPGMDYTLYEYSNSYDFVRNAVIPLIIENPTRTYVIETQFADLNSFIAHTKLYKYTNCIITQLSTLPLSQFDDEFNSRVRSKSIPIDTTTNYNIVWFST